MSSTQDQKSISSIDLRYPVPLPPATEPKKRTRVYLAGPMRGIENNNFPAFFAAEALLRMWGYDVVNPARMDMDEGKAYWSWAERRIIMDDSFTIEDALNRDFAAILGTDGNGGCEAVFVLSGWENSQGALRETWFSLSTGRPLFRMEAFNPVNIKTDDPIPPEEHPYEHHCLVGEDAQREVDRSADAD